VKKGRRQDAAIRRQILNIRIRYAPVSARSAAMIATLQSQLNRLWPRPIHRCEYPRCAVPGGRFFIGRTKDCPVCCRRHPSRKTRSRHRQAAVRRQARGFRV
jgi:hypothetical protein